MCAIGALVLVKVLQNRHPDIHANALVAFLAIALLIFCVSYGIVSFIVSYTLSTPTLSPPHSPTFVRCVQLTLIFWLLYLQQFSRERPIVFRFVLFIIYLLILPVFLVSFYNFHSWKWGRLITTIIIILLGRAKSEPHISDVSWDFPFISVYILSMIKAPKQG